MKQQCHRQWNRCLILVGASDETVGNRAGRIILVDDMTIDVVPAHQFLLTDAS
jgi:hypothetical protein